MQGNYDKPESFMKLNGEIIKFSEVHKRDANRLFYLAVPPDVYKVIATNVKTYCMPSKWVL